MSGNRSEQHRSEQIMGQGRDQKGNKQLELNKNGNTTY